MEIKTVNVDAQQLRSNDPSSWVDNTNLVTSLSSPSSTPSLSTGEIQEKTHNSSTDLILQEVNFILNHKPPWFSFEPKIHTLNESGYRELLERVQGESLEFQEFWHNKLRYDCCLRTSSFVIKMLGVIHEIVKDTVRDSVDEQLKAAKWNIKSIGGGTTLPLKRGYADRQPDIGFRHQNPPQKKKYTLEYQYPAFVIEVAHSQTSKSLKEAACDYILGSSGKIKTVVGIDIGYENRNTPNDQHSSKLATISIWKAKNSKRQSVTVQKVLDAKPFRNADGSHAEFHDVCFTYDDFTIHTQLPRINEPHPISIASKVLFDSLVEGDQQLTAEIAMRASQKPRYNLRKKPTTLLRMSYDDDTDDSSEDTNQGLDKSYYGKKIHQHNIENNSKSSPI
ncbi:hypothetical protein DL98DRAFT_532909 [Cadophora sp. DSE1049]|nr:hypothetical protein DL98DRAFT_532909 [Cadophora sp. DSE1049]